MLYLGPLRLVVSHPREPRGTFAHASHSEMSLVRVRRIACGFRAAHVAPEESRGLRRVPDSGTCLAAVETTRTQAAPADAVSACGRSPRGRLVPTTAVTTVHAAPSPGRRGGEPASPQQDGWTRSSRGLVPTYKQALCRPPPLLARVSRRPVVVHVLFSLESSSRTCPSLIRQLAARSRGVRFCGAGDRCLCAPDRSRGFTAPTACAASVNILLG